jgi:proteasome lid subunit RPN8/RPN11/TolA-binding protein
MKADIEFGDLEEAQPEKRLRPDQDAHFAVAVVGSPADDDLRIFADLDVVRETEEHAASETHVELGGVLLGGQHQDDTGAAFVVITDSLRARHYENSQGSFKFTHDTWEQISREREQFAPDLRMVGWYHTHPGWGVFLSGMDTFICDHFFNRPLDVALVIDPCRQERGFFQWSRGTPQNLRPVAGFYLISARFRRDELDRFAAHLESKLLMSGNPRLPSLTPAGTAAVPVVHLGEGSRAGLLIAVLSSLTIQLCVLALIAWRVLAPSPLATAPDVAQQLASLPREWADQAELRQREAEMSAKLAILDEIVGRVPGGQQGLASALAEKTREVEELRASHRGHVALQAELDARIASLQSELRTAQSRGERLSGELDDLRTSLIALRQEDDLRRKRLAELESQVTTGGGNELSPGTLRGDRELWNWTWLAIGGTAACLALGGLATAILRWKRPPHNSDSHSEETSDPTNSGRGGGHNEGVES